MNSMPKGNREPDFAYLERVLRLEPPGRPVLFELFMNEGIYDLATEDITLPGDDAIRPWIKLIFAYKELGYDYATLMRIPGSLFVERKQEAKTISLNGNPVITDWKSFEEFRWPSAETTDFHLIEKLSPLVPPGMKLLAAGPGGVEENVISLVGYENLCYMMADDPSLAEAVFNRVGSSMVEYYKKVSEYPVVGGIISNDDWGFKTQTLLTAEQMESYLFPWHKRITDIAHDAGLPVILHSCGNIYPLMERVIDYLSYDAKHSYEDEIKPVEEAYEEYGDRIAVLGGIDLDFVCQKTPEEIYRRSKEMLERAEALGGYALGTGNSVPDYVPVENYFALLKAGLE